MAKSDYGRDMYRQLTEVMARLERVEEKSQESEKKHETEIRDLKAAQKEEIRRIREEHRKEKETLEREITGLKEENTKLKAEVARLKSNDDNDSHNSSMPPSKDQKTGKAVNEYNGRKREGRKSGGQAGHKGKTLRMADVQRKLQEKGIKIEIEEIGEKSEKYKDRLIIDLPLSVKPIMKRFYADKEGRVQIPNAYKNEVTYGDNIKALVMVLYGQGVQSLDRIVELIYALTGNVVKLSEGTVSNWLEEMHRKSEQTKKTIEKHLIDAPQVSTDGTVVTENGHQSYIRNFSILDWVLYESMGSKGHKALSSIPFLRQYAGTLVHDHETSLYSYGLDHAECNVHLLRYLIKNGEDTKYIWSSKLLSLLVEMNEYRKRLMGRGEKTIPDKTLQRLEARYDELLEHAKQERKDKPSGFRWATKEETSLLNRLKKYKRNHLLFLHDFNVPFDNNMSERDLRKCKNRQKMSGGFRTEAGKEIFCSLLTITETCKRQGKDLINAFKTILSGDTLFA